MTLYPIFLKLGGREVLLVGGGKMALSRLAGLLEAGARVTAVAPTFLPDFEGQPITLHRRPFAPSDVDGAWLVVSAAPREVNREVFAAAEARRVFVNSIDDPETASAYAGGVVRKGGALLSISTEGRAPALAGLLREALDALLPDDLGRWTELAEAARVAWKAQQLPLEARRPLLLEILNQLYRARGAAAPEEGNLPDGRTRPL